MKRKPPHLVYCQDLLAAPVPYALTNFVDHTDDMSHDVINRMLPKVHLSPQTV